MKLSSNNQDKIQEDSKSKKSGQDIVMTDSLIQNIDPLKKIFSYPINEDFIVREIFIRSLKKNAVLLYMDGMVDMKGVQRYIMSPLVNDDFQDKV